jgi:hypothetical protein
MYLRKPEQVLNEQEDVNLFQTTFGKIFWSFTVVSMLALGSYWCVEAYQTWTEQPVLTTINTAELPVEKVKIISFVKEFLTNFGNLAN